MKTKTMIIVTGMLLPILSVKAQTIRPLNIGDTVPDIVLHNVINYKDSVVRLSDFKGKLVILDFWATWCSGCQPLVRKLDTLQKEIPDVFVPIIVSQDKSLLTVQNYLRKNSRILSQQKPFVMCTDSLLALFPHNSIPHEVVIGKDRVVKAVTFEEFITKDNILSLFKGTALRTNLKRDLMDYSKDQYLWALMPDTSIRHYSLITRYIDGIRGVRMHLYEDKNKSYRRFYAINRSIPELYSSTFTLLTNGLPETTQVQFYQTEDSSLYYQRSLGYATDWQKRHTYSIDFIRPYRMADDSFKVAVRKELDLYFGWTSSIKDVQVDGYVIKPKSCEKLSTKRPSRGSPAETVHSLKELVVAYNRSHPSHPVFYADSLNGFLESQRVPMTELQMGLDKLVKILRSFRLTVDPSRLHYKKLSVYKP